MVDQNPRNNVGKQLSCHGHSSSLIKTAIKPLKRSKQLLKKQVLKQKKYKLQPQPQIGIISPDLKSESKPFRFKKLCASFFGSRAENGLSTVFDTSLREISTQNFEQATFFDSDYRSGEFIPIHDWGYKWQNSKPVKKQLKYSNPHATNHSQAILIK